MTYCKWRHLCTTIVGRLSLPRSKFKRNFGTSETCLGSKPRTKNDAKVKASSFIPVIGLEIHAQILADSKLFSGAASKFGDHVNSSVSLLDAAIPGTLPVINRRCVEAAVLCSLALGCRVNLNSSFDRKHYFYADMPAGYQITQHFNPIGRDGHLSYVVLPRLEEEEEDGKEPEEKIARIVQVQIEQDSGKSIHDVANGVSLIDLNRAGQGLLEIVTAPDFGDADDAVAFATELRLLLMSLGVCAGKLNEGNFRIDANVSLHREGEPLGIRTEIKNLNHLKGAKNAIDFEIGRQRSILASGGFVVNETLGFDSATNRTVPMRDKEVVTDYRFFPEPNLPPLRLSSSKRLIPGSVDVDVLASLMPEFPGDIRRRLIEKWRLTPRQSAAIVGIENMAPFFEKVAESLVESSPDMVSLPDRPKFNLPPAPQPCPPQSVQFWSYCHPSKNLNVFQTAADILIRGCSSLIEEQIKISSCQSENALDSVPKMLNVANTDALADLSDLTIADVPLLPYHVAALTTLIERNRFPAFLAKKMLLKLISTGEQIDRTQESDLVHVMINELDLWMINDPSLIRSVLSKVLEMEPRLQKEILKSNTKRSERAKLNIIAMTIQRTDNRASPILVKEIVENYVTTIKSS